MNWALFVLLLLGCILSIISPTSALALKCESATPNSCVEEALVKLKGGDTKSGRELLQKGCDGSVARACLKAGVLAEKAGEFDKAKALYQRACDLDKRKDCPNVNKVGVPKGQ